MLYNFLLAVWSMFHHLNYIKNSLIYVKFWKAEYHTVWHVSDSPYLLHASLKVAAIDFVSMTINLAIVFYSSHDCTGFAPLIFGGRNWGLRDWWGRRQTFDLPCNFNRTALGLSICRGGKRAQFCYSKIFWFVPHCSMVTISASWSTISQVQNCRYL
jgi:hypothetical protein